MSLSTTPAFRRQYRLDCSTRWIKQRTSVGRVTYPFFGIYGASKFGVEALNDSLRYELSQPGIDVVLVQPSANPTRMYDNAQQPADADSWRWTPRTRTMSPPAELTANVVALRS